MWLWSGSGTEPPDADRIRQAHSRRFELEHTFRLFKLTPG